jgi:hypothetical protein
VYFIIILLNSPLFCDLAKQVNGFNHRNTELNHLSVLQAGRLSALGPKANQGFSPVAVALAVTVSAILYFPGIGHGQGHSHGVKIPN